MLQYWIRKFLTVLAIAAPALVVVQLTKGQAIDYVADLLWGTLAATLAACVSMYWLKYRCPYRTESD